MSNEKEKGMEQYFFRASSSDFKKIPGSPIAYAASKSLQNLFSHGRLRDVADTRLGMATADNDLFLRMWFEVSTSSVEHGAESRVDAIASRKCWFPYQKGGEYRKWYGNKDFYVNWENDGELIQSFTDQKTGKVRSHNYNLDFIFRRGVTWNALTSSKTSARISTNSLFDNAGSSLFLKEGSFEELIIGFINSNIMLAVFPLISPTLNYQPGDLSKLPAFFPPDVTIKCKEIVCQLIKVAQSDWDAYERSWGFSSLPLLHSDYRQSTVEETYQKLRAHWLKMTLEMQRLEEENNRIFIDAYGLQDELTPEVPLKEITLTCNPHYRYRGNKSETELERLLLADTMKEFISYAVGCMFGRYALDKPGLILANQGETLADYQQQIPESSYPADANNVIPILDGNWFSDDISERFFQFLRTTFGQDHYHDNLAFIEHALGKEIRNYFLKEFYSDHLKRYKKRPIYWLFSSPKGNFNALIYMHRYRPDTASIVLNDYLREFRTKLTSHKDHLEAVGISSNAPPKEKTKALKEIEKLKKIMSELENYERDVLYPLATEQVEIDLDDGVKVNYPKLGKALKKIAGVSGK